MERMAMQNVIRVVILEDADTTRDGIVSHLSAPDIEIIAASADPRSILTYVEKHHPDAAILDLRIYGDDRAGLTMARRITQTSPTTKCIIFTEHDTAENHIAARDVGAICVGKVARGPNSPSIAAIVRNVVLQGRSIQDAERDTGRHATLPAPQGAQQAQEAIDNPLSLRQREVLYWAGEGLSESEIANELCIAETTVGRTLQDIYNKLGSSLTKRRRYLAVDVARKHKWIDDPGTKRRRAPDTSDTSPDDF